MPLPADRAPTPGRGAALDVDLRVIVGIAGLADALALAPVVRALRATTGVCLEVLARKRLRGQIATTLALFGQAADLDLSRRSARAALAQRQPTRVVVRGASAGAHALARWAQTSGAAVAHLGAGHGVGSAGCTRGEERRRRALSRLADQHFVHDENARAGLLAEGTPPDRVYLLADPAADAMIELHERVRAHRPRELTAELGPLLASVLDGWGGRVVLVRARRREVLDELCTAVRMAAARHPDWLFAWPVPGLARVQAQIHRRVANVANVVLCEPMPTAAFAWLLGRCDAALTDSRSLQTEGAALARPVLVAQRSVERSDLARTGLVRPVGSRALGILAGLERLLLDPALMAELARQPRHAPSGVAAELAALLAPARPATESSREAVA